MLQPILRQQTQATRGLYGLLCNPRFYEFVQGLLGADKARRWIVEDLLDIRPGQRILDVGCGTGELLSRLGNVEYVGIDNNPAYIAQAKTRHSGGRALFLRANVDELQGGMGKFDRVMAIGVLHHLSDDSGRHVFAAAFEQLSPEGFLTTVDPCYFEGQSSLSRWITALDRGKNVRTREAYESLASAGFEHFRSHLKHRPSLLPTTSCVIHAALRREALPTR